MVNCVSAFKDQRNPEKEMIIASLLSLAMALYCYAISQLVQHGKIRFDGSFWDNSWKNKYKVKWLTGGELPSLGQLIPAPNNWYYRFFKIEYKERFPLSATFLVAFTDSYHQFQFWMFNFLSLSIVLAIGFNWWLFLGVLIGTRAIHWSARQILSK